MKAVKTIAMLLASLLVLATGLMSQEIAPGTIIPVQLAKPIDVANAKPGQQVVGRTMQGVALPSGISIPQGARVYGSVITAQKAAVQSNSELTFVFDRVVLNGRQYKLTTNLRAMAAPEEVFDAELPATGPDEGSPESAWTTVQIGNDETVYRGGGAVVQDGSNVAVGYATSSGVSAAVKQEPGSRCRGNIPGAAPQQSFWLFSSDACGLYGFDELKLSHAGRTVPEGQITLVSQKDVRLPPGTALLLRVD